MHMLGEPRTMQRDPRYGDVVADVRRFLEERLAFAVAQGVPEERVWLDPGIGFGKTVEHNLELLRRLDEMVRNAAISSSQYWRDLGYGGRAAYFPAAWLWKHPLCGPAWAELAKSLFRALLGRRGGAGTRR